MPVQRRRSRRRKRSKVAELTDHPTAELTVPLPPTSSPPPILASRRTRCHHHHRHYRRPEGSDAGLQSVSLSYAAAVQADSQFRAVPMQVGVPRSSAATVHVSPTTTSEYAATALCYELFARAGGAEEKAEP